MLNKPTAAGSIFFLLLVAFLAACADQDQAGIKETPFTRTASAPTPQIEEGPTIVPLPTTRPRRLSVGELQLAADINDIPAIFAEDALFVDAETGSQEWVDDELVIGVVINDDARAYPIRLLSNHEIVNDIVGGDPVMITWCPLCFTAIVFDRVVAGQELTFGVSGYLSDNNLVMYDHRTNTLWSQVAGEAIRGAHRGEQLAVRPSLMTSWGEWRAAYPETQVLSAVALGTNAGDVFDPYAGYYTTSFAGVTGWANPNDLLPAKELVVGLIIGQEARAYPLALIREIGLVQDELGGVPLLLVYEPALGSVFVYRRDTGQGALNFVLAATEGQVQDEETGAAWDIRSGRALEGTLAGGDLVRLAAPLVYWFAWSDIHFKTDVYPISPVE
jgi:hypothetical protein